MADLIYNDDGTVTAPTGYFSTKQVSEMTLEVAILTLHELRKVNISMATLREQVATISERVSGLETSVQSVVQTLGGTDVPELVAQNQALQASLTNLNDVLASERAADLIEDEGFRAELAALSTEATEAADALQAPIESVSRATGQLNSLLPTPVPEVPTEPATPPADTNPAVPGDVTP
jgi:regulator of replication initiation timing